MPRPKTPIARRLDSVRTTLGLSYAEFWRRLVGEREDGTYEWCHVEEDEESTRTRLKEVPDKPRYSYESSRRYHFQRDAPPEYLARVSEVFGVRLDWLIRGVGETWKAAGESQRSALHDAIAEAYPERFTILPRPAQELFLAFLLKRMRSARNAPDWVWGVAWDSPRDVPEEVVEHAGILLHLLYYPVWRERRMRQRGEGEPRFVGPAWNVIDPRNVPPDHLDRYARHILDALDEVTPRPGNGDAWKDAPRSLHWDDVRQREKEVSKFQECAREAEGEIEGQRPLVGDPDPEEEDS